MRSATAATDRPFDGLQPQTASTLAFVVEILPSIEDDLVAALLDHLAVAILDKHELLIAARLVLSETTALAHAQHREIIRLKTRLAGLLDAHRQGRTAAA